MERVKKEYRFHTYLITMACLCPLLFFFGCSSSTTSTKEGSISFDMEREDAFNTASVQAEKKASASWLQFITSLVLPDTASAELDCNGITTIEVFVYDSSGELVNSGGPWDCTHRDGSIDNIPEGINYRIVAMAKDSSGEDLYRGEIVGIDVAKGQTTDAGIIILALIAPTTNSLGMTFVRIEPGTFMMGSPEDELGRNSDETQHQVTLTQIYYMQTTEVTQGQWKSVMGSNRNPSYFSDCGDDCPVEYISWNDSQEFIIEMNQRGEGTYALPTEAQWECAARAGSTTAFANGDITETGCDYEPEPNLDAMGWYCYNSNSETHPVAQKQANAWGVYDMHGNVWEWCQDWYDFGYSSDTVTDPEGPSSGSNRVRRGGSWSNGPRYCRSAFRDCNSPDIRYNRIGFRLVLSPGQ